MHVNKSLQMSTVLFNGERTPPKIALDRILSAFHRIGGQAYLGRIALEIKYSIEQTHAMFDILFDEGRIRPLNTDEKRRKKIDERCDVWILTEEASPSKANW